MRDNIIKNIHSFGWLVRYLSNGAMLTDYAYNWLQVLMDIHIIHEMGEYRKMFFSATVIATARIADNHNDEMNREKST